MGFCQCWEAFGQIRRGLLGGIGCACGILLASVVLALMLNRKHFAAVRAVAVPAE